MPTGNLLQFLAFLSVTPGWRGFVSASRLLWSAPDLASLAHEFGFGRPPQRPMVFGDTGEMAWTTNGFGWFWLLAYSPRLALFRLDWHVMRVAGGANTGANGANVRWRGGGYERDIVRDDIVRTVTKR